MMESTGRFRRTINAVRIDYLMQGSARVGDMDLSLRPIESTVPNHTSLRTPEMQKSKRALEN